MQTRKLQNELDKLRSSLDRTEPTEREIQVVERLKELLDQEEVMWRQRSHVQWLAAGDRNTRFFHLRASQRRKKNRVSELKREDDSIATDEIELGDMATKFYRELYTSEEVQGMDEVLASVPVKVSELMNNMLDAPFDPVEVKTALFEMYPTKAPGPDGFPAHFFQRNWDLCGGRSDKVSVAGVIRRG
jgi:hypothetical protein